MQGDDQSAYDRGVTVFSPDGRLYQVEYAREAVSRGSATVGVRTEDGVVLASNAPRRSPLLEPGSIEKLHDVDGRIGVATAGHVADGRRLVDYARQFAQRERLRYGEPPGVEPVAKATADFVQETTQTGGTRPFGTALLVGGVADRPALYEIDPSGTPYEWRATAVGAGAEESRRFLEEEYEAGLDRGEGAGLALRALDAAADGLTATDLDLGWMDRDGFRTLDRDEREATLAESGLDAAS